MIKFSKICSLTFALAFCLYAGSAESAETQGKWIRYGKNTVNANQHALVSLLNPIAEADEAKVAAMIKDANGPIPLTIAIQFTQPSTLFYTINTRVSDPKAAVAASKKANEMYTAIQKFLKSNETYLDLGD
jgi:hypothetical protein